MNRLHYRGQMQIGNFQTAAAERVRRCFYYHMNKKRKQSRERDVLLATGYAFTPSNMIMVSNLLREERAESAALSNLLRDERAETAALRIQQQEHAVFNLPLIHVWHSTGSSP